MFKKSTYYKHLLIISLFIIVFTCLSGCQSTSEKKTSDTKTDTSKTSLVPSDVRLVQVGLTEGKVNLQKKDSDKEIQAIEGMNLAKLDTLVTGEKSQSELNIDNDKEIYVWENVRMTIQEILGSAKSEDEASLLEVATGKIFVKINRALKEKETFEIQTPTCVMGVRGTQFYVGVEGTDTDIIVLDGKVSGTLIHMEKDANGNAQEVIIPFSISANEKVHLTLDIKDPKEIIIESVTQADLPSFVLEVIKNASDSISPSLLEKVDQAIATKQDEENKKVTFVQNQLYTNPANGHQYLRVDSKDLNFSEDDKLDASRHLVTITSPEEQAFVEKLLTGGTQTNYLIGLRQTPNSEEPSGGWVWLTGEPLDYTHWDTTDTPGEPSNSFGTENQGVLYHNYREGLWNDADISRLNEPGDYGYLFEWDMLTSSGGKSQIKYSEAAVENPYADLITKENYNKILLGATPADVISILGEGTALDPSELTSPDSVKGLFWGNETLNIRVAFDKDDYLNQKSNTGIPISPPTTLNLADKAITSKITKGMTEDQAFAILGAYSSMHGNINHQDQSITYSYAWIDEHNNQFMLQIVNGIVTHTEAKPAGK